MSDAQHQRSGDDSLNVQAGGNVSFGMSYTETKDLAQVTAREAARIEMEQRMQEIADAVYARLQAEKPAEAQRAVASPDFQIALFDVQKGYARTGDPSLRDMLLNLLVNRVGTDDRPLLHAVLGEALVTAAKLIPPHFDVLTAIFVFRHAKSSTIVSTQQLSEQFKHLLVPFIHNWPLSASTFEYLEYTGCGAVDIAEVTPAAIVRSNYPALFPGPQDDDAVDAFLKSIDPKMIAFVDGWKASSAKNFSMTAVGKAIAHGNFERRTGENPDLSIWVN